MIVIEGETKVFIGVKAESLPGGAIGQVVQRVREGVREELGIESKQKGEEWHVTLVMVEKRWLKGIEEVVKEGGFEEVIGEVEVTGVEIREGKEKYVQV